MPTPCWDHAQRKGSWVVLLVLITAVTRCCGLGIRIEPSESSCKVLT